MGQKTTVQKLDRLEKRTKFIVSAASVFVAIATLSGISYAKTVNPFEDGVQLIHLTPSQRQDLLDYVDTSKQKLLDALKGAQGKDSDATYNIYRRTLIDVVMNSYGRAGRGELLMRIALNEALQLTIGEPTADGTALKAAGLLKDHVSRGLITAIFEDSIHLALKYCAEDRKGVAAGNLIDLPYLQFANARLNLATTWLSGIFDDGLLLQAQTTILQNWHSTVARSDNMHLRNAASSVLQVEEALKKSESSQFTQAQKVRYLRGQLVDLLKAQGTSWVQTRKTDAPYSGSVSADECTIKQVYENSEYSLRIYKDGHAISGNSKLLIDLSRRDGSGGALGDLKKLVDNGLCRITAKRCEIRTDNEGWLDVFREGVMASNGWHQLTSPTDPRKGALPALKRLIDFGYCLPNR